MRCWMVLRADGLVGFAFNSGVVVMVSQDRGDFQLWDVKQVAAALGVSTKTVYRLRDSGKLPRPLKIGRSVRWRVGDIQKYVRKL